MKHTAQHITQNKAHSLYQMFERGQTCAGLDPENVTLEPWLQSIEENQYLNDPEPDRYFYHTDHLGSSSWITDASGSANQHLQYLPFGEQFIDQRSTGHDIRYKFTGKERDAETGFDYFGARYYDNDLSIWLSVDPLAFKYPQESPYSYVGNRPINTIDPWGMDKIKDPNGNETNAGEGYKATEDGKYLYGEGLKTKVWDPDLEIGGVSNGQTKGGYVDYEGDPIDFDSYGKLSGGRYDGKTFSSIQTGSGMKYGSSWSVSKTIYKNSDYITYSEAAKKDLVNWGKAYQKVGLSMGAISLTGGIRGILTNPKKFIKGINPMTLMMTHLYLTGVKTEELGEQYNKMLMNYFKLHGENPGQAEGVYKIDVFFSTAIPMGGGSSSYRASYFYDINTGKFLGVISY